MNQYRLESIREPSKYFRSLLLAMKTLESNFEYQSVGSF